MWVLKKGLHGGMFSEQYCRSNGMSEAIFRQVMIAEDQFPSFVAYFRDDKTPYNSKLLSGDDDRGEGRGRQIGKSTPDSMVLSGAAVPSAYTGDWQLLYVPPVGRTDWGGGGKKNGFRGRIAEVAERTGSYLSWKGLQ